MSEEKDLGQTLDELAVKLADAAAKDDVKLSDRMEVFKILSNHYVNVSKVKPKGVDTQATAVTTMSALRDKVSASSQGDTDEPT